MTDNLSLEDSQMIPYPTEGSKGVVYSTRILNKITVVSVHESLYTFINVRSTQLSRSVLFL